MTEFGYDLAGESVALFQRHEIHSHNTINEKNQKVSRHITQMEKLQKFLTLAAERTADSNRLEMTLAEDQALVDDLRSFGDVDHIFPPGKYVWKEKEIEHLQEKVSQHIQGPLQRQINMLSEEMVLIQHEDTKALDLFKNGLSRMTNMIERIQSNIQRQH